LAAVRVLSRVGRRKDAGAGMAQGEVFIRKGRSVNRSAACAVPIDPVTTLNTKREECRTERNWRNAQKRCQNVFALRMTRAKVAHA
jgi:hypothetical protein